MPGKRKKTFEERVIPNEERCQIRKSRKAQESGALHPPDPKSALKERGILACAPCVQAARVARAARESGAMHPALCRSAGTVRQLQRLPHAYSVHIFRNSDTFNFGF